METVTPDDALYLVENLLPTGISSRKLGLTLGLPEEVVEHIHHTFSEPDECLFHVLIEFTRQTESRPTWNAFIDTLRRPEINLLSLAETLEAPLPSHDVPHSKSTGTCNNHTNNVDTHCKIQPCIGPRKICSTGMSAAENWSLYV